MASKRKVGRFESSRRPLLHSLEEPEASRQASFLEPAAHPSSAIAFHHTTKDIRSVVRSTFSYLSSLRGNTGFRIERVQTIYRVVLALGRRVLIIQSCTPFLPPTRGRRLYVRVFVDNQRNVSLLSLMDEREDEILSLSSRFFGRRGRSPTKGPVRALCVVHTIVTSGVGGQQHFQLS